MGTIDIRSEGIERRDIGENAERSDSSGLRCANTDAAIWRLWAHYSTSIRTLRLVSLAASESRVTGMFLRPCAEIQIDLSKASPAFGLCSLSQVVLRWSPRVSARNLLVPLLNVSLHIPRNLDLSAPDPPPLCRLSRRRSTPLHISTALRQAPYKVLDPSPHFGSRWIIVRRSTLHTPA